MRAWRAEHPAYRLITHVFSFYCNHHGYRGHLGCDCTPLDFQLAARLRTHYTLGSVKRAMDIVAVPVPWIPTAIAPALPARLGTPQLMEAGRSGTARRSRTGGFRARSTDTHFTGCLICRAPNDRFLVAGSWATLGGEVNPLPLIMIINAHLIYLNDGPNLLNNGLNATSALMAVSTAND